jgi:hypothetical protein
MRVALSAHRRLLQDHGTEILSWWRRFPGSSDRAAHGARTR